MHTLYTHTTIDTHTHTPLTHTPLAHTHHQHTHTPLQVDDDKVDELIDNGQAETLFKQAMLQNRGQAVGDSDDGDDDEEEDNDVCPCMWVE